ncbi:MAG: protein tyrosine phosphatase [Hyphomonadaceae bacterium]|nr:protein tyrosine phosphatase [Hyphomonadaceae bacterium]
MTLTDNTSPGFGRFDLSTSDGRRRAEADLMWSDHGFLRAAFQNFHWISPEMARANQPSPKQIARYAAQGFKTIINLRGDKPTGYYLLEKEACARHGLALIDAPLGSREAPSVARVLRAKEIFETIAYPALMHCKSGADRAGLMAVLYVHFRQGRPIEEAVQQLDLKYLHVKQGKTGVLGFFFDTYLREASLRETSGAANGPSAGKSFLDWVQTDYEPARVQAAFMGQWWANTLVDKVLRRE